MPKTLQNIIALLIFVGFVFFFRERLTNQFFQVRNQYLPCRYPITYSLGTFDERFGLSQKDFLAVIKQGEDIWEKPIGLNLFEAKTNGHLKINLIYDDRQKVTEKLKIIGGNVDVSRATYDRLKAEYISLNNEYQKNKAEYNLKFAALKTRQSAYNEKVAYWNARGGAPRAEFNSLEAEKQFIQKEQAAVSQLLLNLNKEIAVINDLVASLNQMGRDLNLDVQKFNEVGATRGEEFEEGLYKSRPEGESIDIYQYDSKTKLIRVMAHEFGHALGLEHLEDSKAIMYKLNQGTNAALAASDLAALKLLCEI